MTVAFDPLLKIAVFPEPFVMSQGVPLTPDQLLALMSQVAPLAPVHVPVSAWVNCGAKSPDRRMKIPKDKSRVANREVLIVFFPSE